MIFTYFTYLQFTGEWYSQGKKYNFITIIDEINNIFFWNPFVSRLLFEPLKVTVWNLIICAW